MRLLAIFCFSLLLFTPDAIAKINVFACEPEWKALVDDLGGEYVKTYSATTAYQDPHHIEARPSLIAKTRRADLLVCTGAELEVGWLPLLLRQSGNAVIQEDQPGYFLAASQVERIEIPVEVDRSQGDVHASGNPHVHWDPYRMLVIAEALSQRLQAIDPEHVLEYKQQLSQFTSDWKNAIRQWEEQTKGLQGKKAIVYHKNWSYLLNWLGVETVGDIEPKPGVPPTAGHLSKLLEAVRAQPPDFILIANYQDDKGAQWLHQKTGIPIIHLPYTVGGSEQADGLVSLYNEVLTLITSTTQ